MLGSGRTELALSLFGMNPPDSGEALLRGLSSLPWARHIGTVPHAQMASLLSQSDVVLNCSVSEGGMANSVLEALMAGRAVLASDIEGNRSLVDDGARLASAARPNPG